MALQRFGAEAEKEGFRVDQILTQRKEHTSPPSQFREGRSLRGKPAYLPRADAWEERVTNHRQRPGENETLN